MKLTERLLLIIDAVTIAVVFLGSFYVRFWTGWFDTYLHTRETHYLIALPVISLIQLGTLWFLGAYSVRRPTSYPAQLITVAHSVTLTALFFLAIVFWYRTWSFSRWVIVLYSMILTLLLPILRIELCRISSIWRRKGFDCVPLLAICSKDHYRETENLMASNLELGYRLAKILKVEELAKEKRLSLYSLLGATGTFDIYLAISQTHSDLSKESIEQSKEEAFSIHIHPSMYTQLRSHPRWRVIDDGVWYTLERVAWDRLYQVSKRFLDIFLSILILFISLPLQAAIALGIRLEGPGPIVFKQERAGLNGRPFTIYKYRSMQVGAEDRLEEVVDLEKLNPPVFKLRNDPRVTPFGRFLRRFSLDELPQFWNVLQGNMSLVGPRPEELWITEHYDEVTRQRLRIKPGMTGYQQIRVRGTDDMELRLNHDIYYLDHQSIVFDIYILLQTVWVVLWGKGRT